MARQLPLPFVHRPDYAEPFLAAPSNAGALAWLERTADWPSHRLALWGEGGCGKTHLLRLWTARVGGSTLDGAALPDAPPDRPVGIDGAEAALGNERKLLHFLNAAAEAGYPVVLVSRALPSRWPAGLPDLSSRLRATTAVEIRPAEDQLLAMLLARLLAERQLHMPDAVRSWLLLRLPRTPAAVREAVTRLDALSLAARGGITRAMAGEVAASVSGAL